MVFFSHFVSFNSEPIIAPETTQITKNHGTCIQAGLFSFLCLTESTAWLCTRPLCQPSLTSTSYLWSGSLRGDIERGPSRDTHHAQTCGHHCFLYKIAKTIEKTSKAIVKIS